MYSYCDLFLGVATTTWYDSTRKQHILILGFVIYFNPIHYFFFCCFIINSLDCKLDCCLKMSTSSFLNMVLNIGMESFHAIAIFNRSISSSWNNFLIIAGPLVVYCWNAFIWEILISYFLLFQKHYEIECDFSHDGFAGEVFDVRRL